MNAIKVVLLISCLVLVADSFPFGSFRTEKVREANCDILCGLGKDFDAHKSCCSSKGYAGASCSISNGVADGACVKMGM